MVPKKQITSININARLSTSTKTTSLSLLTVWEENIRTIHCETHTSLALGTLMHQSPSFSSSSLTDMINGKCWTFFPSFLHPSEARLRNWNIFWSRSWKIFIFNCKYFSLKLVLRCVAASNLEHDAKYLFLAWMILRLDIRDDC